MAEVARGASAWAPGPPAQPATASTIKGIGTHFRYFAALITMDPTLLPASPVISATRRGMG
ncbi:hypothetical protein GCM10027589_19080 [Actinocorallia lasiicapitis]